MTDLIHLPAYVAFAQTPAAAPGAASAPPSAPVEVVGVPGAAPSGTTAGEVAPGSPTAPVQPAPAFNLLTYLPLFVMVIGLFWLMSIPQRKEQKKLEALRKNLTKNDRVQTSGGILGTVVEIGEHEVVLRVDEASNTRIRFAKAAILHVLNRPADAASTPAKAGA